MTVAMKSPRDTRILVDILRGTRALMEDPYSVVQHPKKNGYETAEGERMLLSDDEAGPVGMRCSFATAPRQLSFELGFGRFNSVVNHAFGLLHIEAAERGWHSLDTALADAGVHECLSVIDSVLDAVTHSTTEGST